jgi:7,8-dihydropterin-6-yl-methyl-4-(beta-D-ribofuranosyl)aminobenzene 5'-phosphate synthase
VSGLEAIVRILVDNRVGMVREPYLARHGLAVVVEVPSENFAVLFDTGPSTDVLRHNLEVAGMDPEFDAIVISHEHWDHTGGLEAVSGDRMIEPGGGEVDLLDGVIVATETFEGTYDGEVMPERSLVVGDLALVGCCHFELGELLEGYEPRRVLGGLHLMDQPRERLDRVVETLREHGVRRVYACHCTGIRESAYLADRVGGEPGYVPLAVRVEL